MIVYAQLKKSAPRYANDFKSLIFCITISKAKKKSRKKIRKKEKKSWERNSTLRKSPTTNFLALPNAVPIFGDRNRKEKKFFCVYEHNTRKINTKMSLNFSSGRCRCVDRVGNKFFFSFTTYFLCLVLFIAPDNVLHVWLK